MNYFTLSGMLNLNSINQSINRSVTCGGSEHLKTSALKNEFNELLCAALMYNTVLWSWQATMI